MGFLYKTVAPPLTAREIEQEIQYTKPVRILLGVYIHLHGSLLPVIFMATMDF